MKRTAPLRATGPDRATVKLRKCAVCRSLFLPRSMTHKACTEACAVIVGAAKTAKTEAKVQREDKRQTRAQIEALKTRSDWIKDAQKAFNRYVRLRDAGKPCICCGLPLETDAVGGGYDCGHYRSVGSAPHLRFDERNAAGQRKQCNRYGAGRAVDYRKGLIARLGVEAVERLESDNTPRKYTVVELKAIRDGYRKRANVIQKSLK